MNQELKTAIVFGATGLVGTQVVKTLLEHPAYQRVLIFVRKPSGIVHEKLQEHLIDFTKPGDWNTLVNGDEIYSCFGNNITQSSDKAMWQFVDHDLPMTTARIARENGVKACAFVSSIGANSKASNSYLRIKGEVEEELQSIGFQRLVIVRPSFLLGKRQKVRWHEEPARWLMRFFGLFMFGPALNFKAIRASTVAKAMVAILNLPQDGQIFFTSRELRKLGR
jgi:uncharacterized protein YbjT (DUF2867 family)